MLVPSLAGLTAPKTKLEQSRILRIEENPCSRAGLLYTLPFLLAPLYSVVLGILSEVC